MARRDHGVGHRVRCRRQPRAELSKRTAALAALALAAAAACSPKAGAPAATNTGLPAPPTVASLADTAHLLAAEDRRPARKSVYLAPLRQLRRSCQDGAPPAVGQAVEALAHPLVAAHLVPAPRAAAAAALAATAARGSNCSAV
ncbi:MAG TPA: hypothetical protein VHE56_13550, partial [Mycobacteriales bacterium]|nr:hypothetical protein [Mycobacteriales bacterium]